MKENPLKQSKTALKPICGFYRIHVPENFITYIAYIGLQYVVKSFQIYITGCGMTVRLCVRGKIPRNNTGKYRGNIGEIWGKYWGNIGGKNGSGGNPKKKGVKPPGGGAPKCPFPPGLCFFSYPYIRADRHPNFCP